MRWVLGLDLQGGSTGAVQLASWLCRSGGDDPGDAIQAVHAIEPEVLVELTRFADVPAVEGSVLAQAKRTLEEANLAEHLAEPMVVSGRTTELVLEAAAVLHDADALVVGRRAPGTGVGLSRLGHVARRLLRRLNAPVLVSPPDLLGSNIGEGPVVVGVDATESCGAAVNFGRKLGLALGRKVHFVHVVRSPAALDYARSLLGEGLEGVEQAAIADAQMKLGSWGDQMGVKDDEITVEAGPIISTLLGICEKLQAPVLVLGSRQAGLWERATSMSVATELAASAPIPVAVVPPDRPVRAKAGSKLKPMIL